MAKRKKLSSDAKRYKRQAAHYKKLYEMRKKLSEKLHKKLMERAQKKNYFNF